MKPLSSTRSALAILLAAIMLFTVTTVPTARADGEAFPEREMNLLLVYDESLESFYSSQGITDIEHRFEQMAKLTLIPFKEALHLTFNVTIMDYSTAFGLEEKSKQCSLIYTPDEDYPWHHSANCNHGSNLHCETDHHISVRNILNIANACATNPSNDYDFVGVFVAHGLCYSHLSGHYYCGGMAYGYGYEGNACSFVAGGHYDCTSDPFQVDNLLSLKGLLSHEFSHLLNLSHADSSMGNCSQNDPCVMRSSFDGVIYTRNHWCSNCLEKISADLNQRANANEGDGN